MRDDAWATYCRADTAVREWLMDTIKKTYHGDKLQQPTQRAVTQTEEGWL